MRGITVTLHVKHDTGTVDAFNRPIEAYVAEPVENVLVAPASAQDVVDSLNLTGKRAEYTLAIPKGDEHEWTDAIVEFWGRKWHVIGVPLFGIEELVPLDWNGKVQVERFE